MRKLSIFILIFFLGWCSCNDIFESDISEDKVFLLAPCNNLETTLSTTTFWWEYVEGADKYNLQVAYPDFNYPERLILDTSLAKNQFIYNISPGAYQWRVKAYNSVYETEYSVFNLTIDSTNDLSGETVILKTPVTNDTTNSLTQLFSWRSLYNADNYNLIIYFEQYPILDTVITLSEYSCLLDSSQGSFLWQVNAANAESESDYSEDHFYLDITSPLKRTLQEPEDSSIISDTIVSLRWVSPPSSGSSEYDSVYIYEDEGLVSAVFLAKTTSNSIQVELNDGIYYWCVKGVDKAGNTGELSDIWSFEIDE